VCRWHDIYNVGSADTLIIQYSSFIFHYLLNKERGVNIFMKATGIVRRIDDLGRVVIPKEIRRTMRIRVGDPLDNSLSLGEKFAFAVHSILKRYKQQAR
jgi:hypothetical protein